MNERKWSILGSDTPLHKLGNGVQTQDDPSPGKALLPKALIVLSVSFIAISVYIARWDS